MATPHWVRARVVVALSLFVGGAVSWAQSTRPTGPGDGEDPSRIVEGPFAVAAASVTSVRISRDGVTYFTGSPSRRVGSDSCGSICRHAVLRTVSDSSVSDGEPDRVPSANNEAAGQPSGNLLSADEWHGGWQAAFGYNGFVPAMIYPDDLVFYGTRTYGRSIDSAYRAGKDVGRRETLFKGALDMYNERMGNPPAPAAGLPGNGWGTYPYAVPPSWDAYSSGTRAGRYEAELWLARDRNLLRTARAYVTKGQEAFRAGKYEEAADAFRLAASSDHGDASSRLLAAHTYFALGRYGTAMAYLRRAFQLQPKIAFLDYSVQAAYGDLGDFYEHLELLKTTCATKTNDGEAWALLGYVYRHSGDRDASTEALTRAYKIDSRDRVVRSLLDVEPDPKK